MQKIEIKNINRNELHSGYYESLDECLLDFEKKKNNLEKFLFTHLEVSAGELIYAVFSINITPLSKFIGRSINIPSGDLIKIIIESKDV
jgi:hypothetical protein